MATLAPTARLRAAWLRCGFRLWSHAVIFWSRTEHGWAVNLDGTDARRRFALPRLELRSSPQGWVGTCHFADGTSRLLSLGRPGSVHEAMRLAIQDCREALGVGHEADLRALLDAPAVR